MPLQETSNTGGDDDATGDDDPSAGDPGADPSAGDPTAGDPSAADPSPADPTPTYSGQVRGCSPAGSAGDFDCELTHDGVTRTYMLHVPSSADFPAPLLLNMHGLTQTASLQRDLSVMIPTSDAEGFLLVHPQGTGFIPSWNAGQCCGSAVSNGVDDVGFLLAIVERVSEGFHVDSKRVFATGLSNGGHMAYRLACEATDVFAAVSVVAGTLAGVPCTPSRPIGVLHFHGDSDNIVGYHVGNVNGSVSVPETVEAWAARNGCTSETQVTYQQGDVTCEAYQECDGGSAAELCTVEGGGHTWPGGNNSSWLGHTSTDISANAYMWSFFEAHPRP